MLLILATLVYSVIRFRQFGRGLREARLNVKTKHALHKIHLDRSNSNVTNEGVPLPKVLGSNKEAVEEEARWTID